MQTKMATRKAFGEALLYLGEKDPNILVLDADLSKSTNSYSFAKKYPHRFFQMGIAEANMIGVAAGLALSGFRPFACSFACFITGRFDQIKMSIAYSGANVCLVGTHAGIGIGEDGYSQQGLEDMALMRSLPSMRVLQPADDIETRSMMEYIVKADHPTYLRLTRQDLPRVHDETYKFSLGKFPLLNPGTDVTLFATGGTVGEALMAAKELSNNGIEVRVYNASSIKPIDEDALKIALKETKILISIEDHQVIGGLYSAMAEKLSEMGANKKLLPIGIKDEFGESGTPESLYEKHGLSKKKIIEFIQKNI